MKSKSPTPPPESATLRAIGVLGFDGVNGLDLTGPMEAFAQASELSAAAGHIPYRLSVIGLDAAPFVTEAGLSINPHHALDAAPPLDTLIVPGGRGLREPATNARIADWLVERAPSVRRLVSVCTGVYGLAPTGLIDGCRVATHWRFGDDLAQRYPSLRVDADALFIKSGRYYTSAGITAGIDLSLALIEEDLGPRMALAVARELVVYLARPGGQQQYSEPLRLQVQSADRFADLVTWIVAHPGADLSVAALAARTHLSPRQFSRRFADDFGCTPAAYVEDLRMGEARHRLTQSQASIETLAASVGYASADVFRRAFERRFGISPAAYRARFGTPPAVDPS